MTCHQYNKYGPHAKFGVLWDLAPFRLLKFGVVIDPPTGGFGGAMLRNVTHGLGLGCTRRNGLSGKEFD
jgi:hypothetical protein